MLLTHHQDDLTTALFIKLISFLCILYIYIYAYGIKLSHGWKKRISRQLVFASLDFVFFHLVNMYGCCQIVHGNFNFLSKLIYLFITYIYKWNLIVSWLERKEYTVAYIYISKAHFFSSSSCTYLRFHDCWLVWASIAV